MRTERDSSVDLLAGVQVVDVSRILAGPFCTQLLADLGADVVKVEPPSGDPTRAWGPPFSEDDGQSAYFRSANRGKRAVALDLNSAKGRAALDELLERADVLVENFLPATARKLCLEPERVRDRHPRLIVASVRSFASDTGARARPGYDFLIQAESGWMQVTGEPAGRPMKVGFALVDVVAGLFLASGIQAALIARARDGSGRWIEVPLMEAALASSVNVASGVLMTEEVPPRFGNAHPHIVPYQSFRTADGEVAIAVGDDRQFERLMRALGLEDELSRNPSWATNPGRVRDRDRVVGAIASRVSGWTVARVLDACGTAGVAAGPVRNMKDALLSSPGETHRAVAELKRADGRSVRVVASPILVDGVRALSRITPPDRPAG